MKNYPALVFGPAFTIETKPLLECFKIKFSSSKYCPSKIDTPPLPSPVVKSPPYAMKPGIILWNLEY